MIPEGGCCDDVLPSLRKLALNQVCFCLATADVSVTESLLSGLASGVSSKVCFGLSSSLSEAILKHAAEIGCLTDRLVTELLRLCPPLNLHLQRAPLTLTDAILHRYPAERCGELEEVRLGWSPHLREIDALLLKIRQVGITGQEDGICPLRVLSLSGCDYLADGVLKGLAARCPSLTSLAVDGCSSLDGSFLWRLSQSCPALSTLSVNSCQGLTDETIWNFMMNSEALTAKKLTSLHLGRCSIGALTTQALMMRGHCIQVLDLSGCPGLGDASIRILCRECTSLRELSLLDCELLSCRGAWQCTQHLMLEGLSIPFRLSSGPDLVPVGEQLNPRGRGGGCNRTRAPRHHQMRATGQDEEQSGSTTRSPPQLGSSRLHMMDSEVAPSLPYSSDSSPRSSLSAVGSVRGRGTEGRDKARQRERIEDDGEDDDNEDDDQSPSPSPPPLPLPPVPPTGALTRLRLQVTSETAPIATTGQVQAHDGQDDSNEPEEAPIPTSLVFPLRRLAPLLPPKLLTLDVRSRDATSLPAIYGVCAATEAPLVAGRPSEADACGGPSTEGARRCASTGEGMSGTSWSVRDGRERAPAFERGSAGGDRVGGGRAGITRRGCDGTADTDGDEDARLLVDLLIAPVDLAALLHACPWLQHLVICGNPDREAANALLPARIRGRGAKALATTETASMHATAAAVACCLLPSFAAQGRTTVQSEGGSEDDTQQVPTLRTLTLVDCPGLPPMAILEALGVAQGAFLEHVILGFSRTPSTAAANFNSLAQDQSSGVEVATCADSEGRVQESKGRNRDMGWEEGVVHLSSKVLETLSVSGEGALTELSLVRCPRLRRLDLSVCRAFRDLRVREAPVLREIRMKDCSLRSKNVVHAATVCWPLEVLHVGGNHALGDEVLVSALTECPRLRSLQMDGCHAVGNGSSLPFLLARQCTAQISLASSCLQLAELCISHAPKFTGAHMVAIASALPCLRRLSISHCHRFLAAGFSGLEGTGDISDGDALSGSQPDDNGEEKGKGVSGLRSRSRKEGVAFLDEESEPVSEHLSTDASTHHSGRYFAGVHTQDSGGLASANVSDVNDIGIYTPTFTANDDNAIVGRSTAVEVGGEQTDEQSKGRSCNFTNERRHRRWRGKSNTGTGRSTTAESATGQQKPESNLAGDEGLEADDVQRMGGQKGRRKDGKKLSKTGRAGGKDRGSPSATQATTVAGKRDGRRAGRMGPDNAAQGSDGDELQDEGEDPFQGMEFTVDGKTRAKLERLASSLPREPGKKQQRRPTCIRFLKGTCPNLAKDCPWAHIPIHAQKISKFKPLIAQAHEALARSPARLPGKGFAKSPLTSSVAHHGISRGAGHKRESFESLNDGLGPWNTDDASTPKHGAFFPNLQFLEIHDCPRLKRLDGLRCPSLAVVRVTSCRWLTSLSLEAPMASELDLSGCVRLEPWDLSSEAGASLSRLQVAILNYCRALHPKFLALLVDHAKHLQRLEIYGAGVLVGPHAGGSWSRGKKEMGGGKRDLSRIESNRIYIKTAARLKSLEKGRPKLTIIRTKKEFSREHEGGS